MMSNENQSHQFFLSKRGDQEELPTKYYKPPNKPRHQTIARDRRKNISDIFDVGTQQTAEFIWLLA